VDTKIFLEKISANFWLYGMCTALVLYGMSCVLILLELKLAVITLYFLGFIGTQVFPIWRGGVYRKLFAYGYLISLPLTLVTYAYLK